MNIIRYFLMITAATALSVGAAGDEVSRYFELAKQYELRERATPPKWASREEPPLFRIAWLTDQHIQNNVSMKRSVAALDYIREVLRPQGVFITGDNIGYTYPGLTSAENALRRQQELQELLRNSLGDIPFWVLPGDNWPQAFDLVFGPAHYAFDLGGFRFVFNSVDLIGNSDGCARFSSATWKWLRNELESHATQPVIYLQHETLLPPSFLDAKPLAALFSEHPQLLLAIGGHLHLDLNLPDNGWAQWVGPSLGRSHRPGFKLISFYPDQIMANSYEWSEKAHGYILVKKYQRVKIPVELRGGLHAPAPGEGAANRSELPPGPRIKDPSLDAFKHTILEEAKAFGVKFTLKQLLKE